MTQKRNDQWTKNSVNIIFAIQITRNEFVFCRPLSHLKPLNRPRPNKQFPAKRSHRRLGEKAGTLSSTTVKRDLFNIFLARWREPRVSTDPDWICIFAQTIQTICLDMSSPLVYLNECYLLRLQTA
jgi:hypothetical protein